MTLGAHRLFAAVGRPLVVVFLLGLGPFLLATSAVAQLPNPFGVDLSTDATSLTSSNGACVPFTVTLQNTGQSPVPQGHRYAVAMEISDTAWTVEQAPPPIVTVSAQQTTTFEVELCPGDNVEDGDRADFTITAESQDDPREPPASDSVDGSVTAQDDRIFGLEVPNIVLWVALGAIVALVLLVVIARSRPSGSVAIACPEASKAVAAGRGTSYPIRIRNEGRTRDVVTLSTSPVPSGWDTFLPLADVPLEPKEEQTVWLSVKSPEAARAGDHAVVQVIARSSNTAGEQARIDTLTTVQDGGRPAAPPRPPAREEPVEFEDEGSVVAEERAATAEKPVAVKRRKR